MGGSAIVGTPRVADSPILRVETPGAGRLPPVEDRGRVRPQVEQLPRRDELSRGGTPAPRGGTPAPIHLPEFRREVSPEESRRYLDDISRGQRDPERWRTAHPITEGLRNGAITPEQLDDAIRSGERELARHFLDEFGRGNEIGDKGQRFIDKGLERGDITSDQLARATEDRESYQTLESLRRGNGRIEQGSEPVDHPAIRRGIERGLFTQGVVDAANAEGEQRKREALY